MHIYPHIVLNKRHEPPGWSFTHQQFQIAQHYVWNSCKLPRDFYLHKIMEIWIRNLRLLLQVITVSLQWKTETIESRSLIRRLWTTSSYEATWNYEFIFKCLCEHHFQNESELSLCFSLLLSSGWSKAAGQQQINCGFWELFLEPHCKAAST